MNFGVIGGWGGGGGVYCKNIYASNRSQLSSAFIFFQVRIFVVFPLSLSLSLSHSLSLSLCVCVCVRVTSGYKNPKPASPNPR